MPRSARLDIPNLLQHVIVRGIERRDIFLNDDDRQDFVQRYQTLLGYKDAGLAQVKFLKLNENRTDFSPRIGLRVDF